MTTTTTTTTLTRLRAEALLLSRVGAPSTAAREALVAAQPVLPHVDRLGLVDVADQQRLALADWAQRAEDEHAVLVGARVVDVDIRDARVIEERGGAEDADAWWRRW